MSEEIENLKKRVAHPNSKDMYIRRVDRKTVDAFKKFANDEFVGDYGMALKRLVNMVLIDPLPFENIYNTLSEHEARISNLEGKDSSNKKVRKTISGRKINKPKE